nr:MAG TPA: hypothetical protein [Microviridae sp.]
MHLVRKTTKVIKKKGWREGVLFKVFAKGTHVQYIIK